MPEFAKPVIGNFCWVEASVEDPQRARGFYGELFGWTAVDMPMPQGSYTMLQIGDKQVAGLTKLSDDAKKMGAPPHWLNYVAVDDTEAAAEKVTKLGGKVVVPPLTVGPGTMAIVQDPTGGTFALWATKSPMGTFLYGEPNTLCWNELTTSNTEKATSFYVGMFGWETEAWPMEDFSYTVLKNEGKPVGGIMPQPNTMAGAPPMWTAYFSVKDCDGTAKRAAALGGKIFVPPTDIPKVGRFALLQDPQGATFAVITNVQP